MISRNHPLRTVAALASAAFVLFSPAESQAAYGDLYQVSTDFRTINKYTPAGTRTTFTSGLESPHNDIAFNKAGELFVSEGTGTAARITKITPGGVKTTFATNIQANGLAFDAADNLFVSDFLSQSIIKITPGGVRSTFAPGVNALDLIFASGFGGPYLFAADFGNGVAGQGKVYAFQADGTKSTRHTNLNRPKTLATDGNILYVGSSDGSILHYSLFFGTGSDPTFATGLGNIQGMACDPAGNLFVSSSESIVKFTMPGGAKTTFVPSAGGPSGLEFEPPRDLALNIATRLAVQTGDNALIAGLIVTGNAPKKVLIRGIGPSLAALGISGNLQDPTIELRNSSGAFVNGNNNWKDTQQAAIAATGAAPTDDRESALVINLGAGAWTVVMRGVSNSMGIGVLEVYDLDPAANSKLANISTRGFVNGGDNVMIGGFILGSGNGAGRVIIRAIGPSLSALGVPNPLANPTLELRNSSGTLLAANNDWEDSQEIEIEETGVQPANELESAIIATVPSGNYTAVVAGHGGGTGVGLVEVYNLQ